MMQTSTDVIAGMQSYPNISAPTDPDTADVVIRRPRWGYDTPKDGLESCEFCHNLRKVQVDAFPGDPLFGKWIPCPKCKDIVARAKMQQWISAQRERIGHYSQLTGRALGQTFDNFDLREDEHNTESIRRGYRIVHAFAQDPVGWLVLYGSCGTGKSHLAAAIANHLTNQKANGKKPPMVLFMTVPSALNLLRSGFDRGDHDELLLLTKEVDVLILDDLGVEKPTGWVRETLYEIINARYQAELPLVIVSNLPPKDLAPRLYDRLSDNDLSTVVQMNAPTYRQRERSPGEVISRN
jgi:DNA replication protein DnaC